MYQKPAERGLILSCKGEKHPTANVTNVICTYVSNILHEWNLLGSDARRSHSISEFKRRLLCKIHPTNNCVFNIYDIEGIRILAKLRLEFSALNERIFRHRYNVTSPTCNCGTANEDNEHFLLHCSLYYNNLHGKRLEFLDLEIPS